MQISNRLNHHFIRFMALLGFLICSQFSLASETDIEYSFGVVPQFEARKIFDIWQPIITELERRTGLKFKLIGSPNIPAFEAGLERGYFDFAYMNPYHMLKQLQAERYRPMVRDGQRKLRGILVVHKDGPIKHVSELAGAKVAFPAPNALGASLLIRAELAQKHFIQIQPHYVGTHSSVYLNVITGLAAAGGGVIKTLKRQDQSVQDNLRILHTTRASAPHPLTVHSRIPGELVDKVKDALLSMAEYPETKTLLSRIPVKEPVTATAEDYLMMSDWGLDDFYEKHAK